MILRSVAVFLGAAWGAIRSLSTDDAYEKYLAHHRVAHGGMPPMSRRQFYIQQQQRKWGGVTRCC